METNQKIIELINQEIKRQAEILVMLSSDNANNAKQGNIKVCLEALENLNSVIFYWARSQR
jgi:hypothetical protein